MLKKIEAIIREDKVNDVIDALKEIGIVGMNTFEVRDMAGRAAFNWSDAPEPIRSICFQKYKPTLF